MWSQDVLVRPVGPAILEVDQLEALYRRFGPIIHRRCLRLLGNEAEALDALQDVFLRVGQVLQDFRGDAEILTWIYRIATNLCLNRLRRRQLEQRSLSLLEVPGGADPRAQLEVSAVLRRLLERMPDDQVQLLIHVHHDGMPQAQIAEMLGVTTRTVRKRLSEAEHRAREIMTLLEKESFRDE